MVTAAILGDSLGTNPNNKAQISNDVCGLFLSMIRSTTTFELWTLRFDIGWPETNIAQPKRFSTSPRIAVVTASHPGMDHATSRQAHIKACWNKMSIFNLKWTSRSIFVLTWVHANATQNLSSAFLPISLQRV
jgi:hypothetical protein